MIKHGQFVTINFQKDAEPMSGIVFHIDPHGIGLRNVTTGTGVMKMDYPNKEFYIPWTSVMCVGRKYK